MTTQISELQKDGAKLVVEKLLQVLKDHGVDLSSSPQLEVELKKTLEIRTVSKLTLDEVMPYPVKEPDHHIYYFVQDEKVEAIRDFIQYLLALQGTNEVLVYRMAAETPATIMNNKEIILQLERLVKENTTLANVFMHLHAWYSPSEGFHWRFIYGVSQQLEQILIHFNSACSEYKAEETFHSSPSDIVEAHEKQAKIDYRNYRTLLHGLENKVKQLSELVRKMTAESPYRPPARLFEAPSVPVRAEKKAETKKEGPA